MSLVKPISLGQVVESIAGRDMYMNYLVVGFEEPNVLLSNGRNRTLLNPKKKNIRHVKVYERISEFVTNKLQNHQKVSDEDIRQVLKNLQAR